MKYVGAVLACLGILILWSILGASLGWKHGGGYIPMLVLMAIIAAVWKALMQKKGASKSELTDSDADEYSCSKCGSPIIKGSKYCQTCGDHLEWEETK